MINVIMKEYVIRSVEYVNNISGTETMEIGAHVESRVDYNDDISECRCTFALHVNNVGESELIKIVVNVEAVYEFSTGDSKKAIHNKINEELFSQARGTVFAICGVVGLPPIAVPPIEFDEANTVLMEPGQEAL